MCHILSLYHTDLLALESVVVVEVVGGAVVHMSPFLCTLELVVSHQVATLQERWLAAHTPLHRAG